MAISCRNDPPRHCLKQPPLRIVQLLEVIFSINFQKTILIENKLWNLEDLKNVDAVKFIVDPRETHFLRVTQ
jgi:hypothetical protein